MPKPLWCCLNNRISCFVLLQSKRVSSGLKQKNVFQVKIEDICLSATKWTFFNIFVFIDLLICLIDALPRDLYSICSICIVHFCQLMVITYIFCNHTADNMMHFSCYLALFSKLLSWFINFLLVWRRDCWKKSVTLDTFMFVIHCDTWGEKTNGYSVSSACFYPTLSQMFSVRSALRWFRHLFPWTKRNRARSILTCTGSRLDQSWSWSCELLTWSQATPNSAPSRSSFINSVVTQNLINQIK